MEGFITVHRILHRAVQQHAYHKEAELRETATAEGGARHGTAAIHLDEEFRLIFQNCTKTIEIGFHNITVFRHQNVTEARIARGQTGYAPTYDTYFHATRNSRARVYSI